MAHLVRCVELSVDHRVGGRLAHVAHPELGGLKVGRVDDKLLQRFGTCERVQIIFFVGVRPVKCPYVLK